MRKDQFGQIILSENDLCDLYLQDSQRTLDSAYTETDIVFSDELELNTAPRLIKHLLSDETVAEFDSRLQTNWHMPDEYKNLDIAEWVLSQCKTDAELQRVGHELMLFLDRNLFPLLQYLLYLVETMRKHNIVWGVGRGSSVSSYVLFLIGVHKIDALYFDLSIEDFLK
jgi:DNA polymerase III alpha subunit